MDQTPAGYTWPTSTEEIADPAFWRGHALNLQVKVSAAESRARQAEAAAKDAAASVKEMAAIISTLGKDVAAGRGIEGRVKTLENTPADTSSLDALAERVSVIENTPVDTAGLDSLARRVTAIENTPEPGPNPDHTMRLEALEALYGIRHRTRPARA